MERCQVRDGPRLITFDGKLLGHVSSWRSQTARWTEMSLYRTEGGSFVLEKVGRSVMCHIPSCTTPPQGWPVIKKPWSVSVGRLPRFQEEHPGDDPDSGYWYCDCVPEEYDFTDLRVEQDRYWAVIADDPAQIVSALYRRKGGARSLPQTSLQLLEAVAEEDPSIADAFRFERIS